MRILLETLTILIFFISCSNNKIEQGKEVNNKDYDLAYQFLEEGKNDSSFHYFNKAKEQFLIQKQNLPVANCLINMGNIQFDQGDFFGSQETVLSSLIYLNQKKSADHQLLSLAYNTIANATDELKQFDDAVRYYTLAIQYCNDPVLKLKYKNNLSVSLRNAKKYKESIALGEENLSLAKLGSKDFARFLNNLAKAKWQNSSSSIPLKDYWLALKIRLQQGDLWGQQSSFASLSQYYTHINADSAFYYAKKQYDIAKKINSPDDQITALKALIDINPTQGKIYFKKFMVLNDSLQNARTAAKNQFALIRYESEKSKAQNLVLEKENEKKESHLLIQRIGIGFLLFSIVLGVFWHKKRKQRLELEAQNKIKQNQLHLSKKIHDVVANGIYRVMAEIEYKEAIDRDGVLDKLDDMYQKSRDISHEVEEQTVAEAPYSEKLADLLKSFASDHRRVLIAGNESDLWSRLNKRGKEEVRHVLQELMVNMKKHSQADQVVIRFENQNNQLEIFYKDNGIGLADSKTYGKGLSNMVSRIESIGGEIIFVREEGKGLSVKINVPIL